MLTTVSISSGLAWTKSCFTLLTRWHKKYVIDEMQCYYHQSILILFCHLPRSQSHCGHIISWQQPYRMHARFSSILYYNECSTAVTLNVLKQHCHLEVTPRLSSQYRINFQIRFREYDSNVVAIHLDRPFLKLE